jgi:hypothetical protein
MQRNFLWQCPVDSVMSESIVEMGNVLNNPGFFEGGGNSDDYRGRSEGIQIF